MNDSQHHALFEQFRMPVRNINHVEKRHPFLAPKVFGRNFIEGRPVRLLGFLKKLHARFLGSPATFSPITG